MTEQAAKSLAGVLGGDAMFPTPCSRSRGVTIERGEGQFAAIEDHAGWVYRDRKAYGSCHETADDGGAIDCQEWCDWDGTPPPPCS